MMIGLINIIEDFVCNGSKLKVDEYWLIFTFLHSSHVLILLIETKKDKIVVDRNGS